MAKIAYDTVKVRKSRYGADCLFWNADGFSWHVWLEKDGTMQSNRTPGYFKKTLFTHTLFKNAGPGSNEKFKTRYLDADLDKSRSMINSVMNHAKENGLFDKAEQELNAAEQKERDENKTAWRIRQMQDAGPALYEALSSIKDSAGAKAEVHNPEYEAFCQIWKIAADALAEVKLD